MFSWQKHDRDFYHCSSQVNMFKHKFNNAGISQNISFNPSTIQQIKPLSIIFCKLPETFNIPDILIGICDIIQKPVDSIQFKKKYKLKYMNAFNWIFDISPDIAKKLLDHKEALIQSNLYPVRKYMDIKRCFRCQAYSHHANFCNEKIACQVCAGPHNDPHCKNTPKCINCIKNNDLNNTQFDIFHQAFAHKCPYLKLYIEEERNVNLKDN